MTLSKNKSSGSNGSGGNVNAGNGHSAASANFQECADCSSTNAQWASLNHGVLICDECCLAHRSLGRCISIIKSLRKSYWPQSLIDTLYELVRNNSNQIWESNLSHGGEGTISKQLSSRSIKKPASKETHNHRLNFIKTKYENLAYISRGKYTSIDELNQQLHGSVRTNNYESTLRILSQGADANYRSHEDGTPCLHAAVLNNQLGQIELLCLYGADVTALDRQARTAYEVAKASTSQQHIADRLLELQFELTDEITHYLCNKRPDHKAGEHFYIPDLPENSTCQEETSRNTKMKLQELPDHLFEELARDIYDEMDRRQIETIWKCTVGPHLVNEPIPFLVIKSCFTQTRNQLRQKLARFNSHEFSCLLIEILNESKRRYFQIENSKKNEATLSRDIKESLKEEVLDEDDPLYDKVPSDEDYASVASESSSIAPHLESMKKAGKLGAYFGKQLSVEKTTTSPQNNHSPLSVMISGSPIHTAANYSSSSTQKSAASNRSNKNTPSPSGPRFTSKVLTTNFDKPPLGLSSNQPTPPNPAASSLVANAESALNSIIHSLNQIDYSHLNSQASPDYFAEHRDLPVSNGVNYTELKSENELMQAMIERLMEENAQLRAEKMLLTTSVNTNNYISQNIHNYYTNEDIALYSTVKNKKFNMIKDGSGSGGCKSKPDSPKSSSKYEQHYDNSSAQHSFSNSPLHHKLLSAKTSKQHKEHADPNEFYLPFKNNLKSNMSLNFDLSNYETAVTESSDRFDHSLRIVEESDERPVLSPSKMKKSVTTLENGKKSASIGGQNGGSKSATHQMQHLKLSPSKPAPPNIYSPSKTTLKSAENDFSHMPMPTKDAVIRKMKKITKAVQELFKATKESEFSLFKGLCEKVDQSVNEMIFLFPQPINSQPIEENLSILTETCKSLMDLIHKYNSQIELFSQLENEHKASSSSLMNSREELKQTTTTNGTALSTSSSSSSAISSGSASEMPASSTLLIQHLTGAQHDNAILKNMIVSNLVTYSYEIAFTVKRIVCIMGSDS